MYIDRKKSYSRPLIAWSGLLLLCLLLLSACKESNGDQEPPALTLDPVDVIIYAPVLALRGSMEEGAQVELNASTSATGGLAELGSTTWNYTFSDLQLGSNVITITASDEVENEQTLAFTAYYQVFTVDDLETPTAEKDYLLTGKLAAGASDLKITTASAAVVRDVAVDKSVVPHTWEVWIEGLEEGVNVIMLRAEDMDGKEQLSTVGLRKDTVPPVINLAAHFVVTTLTEQVLSGTVDSDVTLTVTANEGVTVGDISLAGSVWSVSLSNLVEGENPVTVTAVDSAGNRSERDIVLTLDPLAPYLTLDEFNSFTNDDSQVIYGYVDSDTSVDVSLDTDGEVVDLEINGDIWRCRLENLPHGTSTLRIRGEKEGHFSEIVADIHVDIVRPEITAIFPEDDAENVSTYVDPYVVFSEEMDANSLNSVNFYLKNSDGDIIVALYYYDFVSHRVMIYPASHLEAGEKYRLVVKDDVKDLAGNYLDDTEKWSFRTMEEEE